MIYNIIFNGSNTFNTPINYTIYKTEENIEASYSCSVMNGYVNGGKTYYEECSGNNIDQLGSAISNGTITKGEGKTTLKSDEIILTVPEGKVVYYYIVFEYPNEDASQNDDIGSTISGNITIEEGSKYQAPNINLVASTVSGSNGWYKSADITTNITTQTGNYNAKYCVTTEDSCTPNMDAVINENSFTTILSSNSSSQKICIRVEDEYNQIAEGCSEGYKIDGTNPSITIASTSATENSITITINGSDSHSGIAQYRFSSDNGNSYTDVNTSDTSYTYTFNNLNKGTAYSISVQIIDEAGNVNTITQEIETEKVFAKDVILANYNTVLTRTSFSSTVTATTTGTIYKSANSSQYDDDGEVYYFAGNPTDNWVQFAGFYWRIIRINGDGAIRLIYNGSSTSSTGTGTLTHTSQVFNSSYDNNMYIGFMYTNGQVHGTGTSSSIKTTLDSWYTSSGLDDYGDKLDGNAGFCNDRTPYSGTGTGTTPTYYGGYIRLVTNNAPTFKCSNSSDLFTTSGSSDGNKALTNPIGLITADEVAFAGGVYGSSNSGYYLYNTGQAYWTMSPHDFASYWNEAHVFYVNSNGSIGYAHAALVDWAGGGVRPVINLKADVNITGSGTATNPYVVS